MRRAMAAEWLRVGRDPLLPVMLVVALMLGASIVIALPDGVRDAPSSALRPLRASLGSSALQSGVILAALYGAFRITSDLDRGVAARAATGTPRPPLLLSKLLLVLPGGAAVALLAVGSATVAISLATGRADTAGLGAAAAAGVLGAMWGFGIGVLIRRHLLALAVVCGTLGVTTLVGTGRATDPGWADLTPLASFATVGVDDLADPAWSVVRAIAWAVAAAVAALLVFTRRDLL